MGVKVICSWCAYPEVWDSNTGQLVKFPKPPPLTLREPIIKAQTIFLEITYFVRQVGFTAKDIFFYELIYRLPDSCVDWIKKTFYKEHYQK